MKKLIALLLAMALAASMFGCKEKGPSNEPEAANTKPQVTTSSTGQETTKPDTDTTEPVVLKSYTVSDEEAAAARLEIVATVGDEPLTNGVLQLCYWMGIYAFMGSDYGAYPSLYGLDYSLPLDEQESLESGKSWQEFFLEDGLTTWHLYQSMATAAKEQGITLPEGLQTELDKTGQLLEESAKESGFDTVDEMIQADAGAGCIAEDYLAYTEAYYYYLAYVMHISQNTEVTQADIDAYFAENEDTLAESEITKDSGNVYGVRHILIEPEGGTKDSSGNTTWSDAEWEACRVKAQALLDQWAAGEATEETFAALANTHSTDPGSNTNGGLYQDLDEDTSFVKPFKEWYLDESRQVGDTGLVKTDYGYHIMYMSSIEEEWIAYCRDTIISNAISDAMKAAQEASPLEVDYDKIVLGEVSLVEEE